ncbi:cytochrome D ubiquinol oxidase subunit II [Halostella sp. JP-L12]|uniref:cytochrome d ubiquinol oxidase subunit II n=1 Tax=Halostella TaxID=1843185 RepID=UPI000EF806D9|nr:MULTISPECIES: cytochrome d ubiquinol oxidase subunit II [Halostella]NHN46763.1 cytochrome D ubiquinol oxidase subunit II [Halostella sp. JP-L12]
MIDLVSEDPVLGLALPELWFGVVFAFLGTFLFLDGFDFGVGALFATRSDDEERERLVAAIGPFWDGNEVWLVVFGGALFAAFPAAYAALFSRHYLLLFALLAALGARGLAPEMYEQRHDDRWQRVWGAAFAAGSVASPFLLGAFAAAWLAGAEGSLTLAGPVVGLGVVALTVLSGAAFLGVKTRGGLQAATTAYGVPAVAAYLALVVLSLAALALTAPAVGEALVAPVPAALVALSVALAGGYGIAMRRGRYRLALGAAGGLTYAFVALVAVLLYPAMDPATGLSVADAAVSTTALNLMTAAAAVLIPLVIGYFAVLYSAFAGPVDAGDAY